MLYKLYVPKTGKMAGTKCCLVRAEGGKEKISTVISESEKKQFQVGLADIMTIQMTNLKSRPKKRRRKKNTKRSQIIA